MDCVFVTANAALSYRERCGGKGPTSEIKAYLGDLVLEQGATAKDSEAFPPLPGHCAFVIMIPSRYDGEITGIGVVKANDNQKAQPWVMTTVLTLQEYQDRMGGNGYEAVTKDEPLPWDKKFIVVVVSDDGETVIDGPRGYDEPRLAELQMSKWQKNHSLSQIRFFKNHATKVRVGIA